jgi:rhamnosyltransferase subunit B
LNHHYLLFPVGSHGDVHPFAGIARELQRRGERVTVFTSGHFKDLFEPAGIDFVDILPDEEFRDLIDNEQLWAPGLRSMQAVMALAHLGLGIQFEAVKRHMTGPRPRVVAGALAFGARCAAERFGIEAATIQLSPVAFLSAQEPPTLPGLWMPPWLPMWARELEYRIADHVSDRLLMGPTRDFRDRHGLPQIRGMARHWFNSPNLTIAMFPGWYAPPAEDWPASVEMADFPLWDERGEADIPAEATDFLASCPPPGPIIFTPGSAMVHGRQFFKAAVDLCVKLDAPGILLTRHPHQLPQSLPSQLRHFDYLPFSWLLPQASCLIHHGGIGTVSQALRAGTPQLIAAMAYDQPDNGKRITQIGAGLTTTFDTFCSGRAVAKVRQLHTDDAIRTVCKALAIRLDGERTGIKWACDLLTRTAWGSSARL